MTKDSEFVEMMMDAMHQSDELNEITSNVQTFEEAGMMTKDEGFVVMMKNGTKFYVMVTER